MNHKILIADDDPQQRRYLSAVLSSLGYGVITADGGIAAIERLESSREDGISLALLDLHMPDLDGINVLERARENGASLPILVLTSDGSVTRAVDAMRAGANDFIVKPVSPERLDVSIRNALSISSLSREVQRLSRQADNRLSFEDLVAVSPATRDAIALARRVARSDIPVLIQGESGTGKEVFASAIHGSGERAGGPFVAVNCGALPAALVESILFGHEKGAFTGATERRRGKFQEASGGTLFLDEIGELPLDAQVKLLRSIQTGEVDPVGGAGPVKVDIRLISATNRDLQAMIAEGRFREDLYYRVGVFPLTLPPLRERRDDLPGLARMFLARSAASEGMAIDTFSTAAMEAISRASFPGNVRQLQNIIQRAVILADGPVIRPQDLHGLESAEGTRPTGAPAVVNRAGVDDADTEPSTNSFLNGDGHIRRLLDIEGEAIARALTLYRGRMTETARRLGIGRSTLYRKIDELQLDNGGR
ncbi:MAG TPA: sigma-54 dependent transcriptional regulator [Thermohalobaculum sp.]|nr:sigma-54 dependent transcriptional regulator [Thermohalobaculum sp.]